MKSKILICVFMVALLLLSACSTQTPEAMPDTSPTPQQSASAELGGTASGKPEVQEDTTQLWSADEFRQNEEDVMFFVPATENYMLTEAYGQEQPDTGVIYTLTILRSFDEAGKVVAQIEKYSFDIPPDARFCYDTFNQDGTEYPSLVCVGYAVYVEQPADVVAEQRTKEQFISDYQMDGIKHWLSIP